MQVYEARVIRNLHSAPKHMREEANRIVMLHDSLTFAGAPVHGCDFATVTPDDLLRANKILICNLMLACSDRSWLPVRGRWVW